MAEFILFLVLTTQVPYLWHADQTQDPIETQESYDLLDDSERCEILKDQAACELANEE